MLFAAKLWYTCSSCCFHFEASGCCLLLNCGTRVHRVVLPFEASGYCLLLNCGTRVHRVVSGTRNTSQASGVSC